MIVIDGAVEMQQNEPGSLAAVGDSIHETSRAYILGYKGPLNFAQFKTDKGFVRHPRCIGVPGWNEADMSNDGLLPYMLATGETDVGTFYIKGTKTLLSLGSQLVKLRLFRLLALANFVQSWIGTDPADTLNLAVITVYLRSKGYWAPLTDSDATIMAMVVDYYDVEPNPWIVPYYRSHFPGGTTSP